MHRDDVLLDQYVLLMVMEVRTMVYLRDILSPLPSSILPCVCYNRNRVHDVPLSTGLDLLLDRSDVEAHLLAATGAMY